MLQEHSNKCCAALSYTKTLVNFESITPKDAGCQAWIAEKLKKLGFEIISLPVNGVSNMIARYVSPNSVTKFSFCGHTDVVPAGEHSLWSYPPFAGQIVNNKIYGRGVADMKGAIAAMLAAIERFFDYSDDIHCDIYVLLTSDEEGEAQYGTKEIKSWLDAHGVVLDYCLVMEPSCNNFIGDTIKIGRRGAISGSIECKGKSGHVAYPQYAHNAIHHLIDISTKLTNINWRDEGSEDFPGTSLQITGFASENYTDNIIPASAHIKFNIRYSHQYNETSLKNCINVAVGEESSINIQWERACEAYMTTIQQDNCIITMLEKVIYRTMGNFPLLSTAGGTSDGRFLADDHTQVIEFGLSNKTIHQINESVDISDITDVSYIYEALLKDINTRAPYSFKSAHQNR